MPATPDAGWYPNPDGSRSLRWWDGGSWTGAVRGSASAGMPPPQHTPANAPFGTGPDPAGRAPADGGTGPAARSPLGAFGPVTGPFLAADPFATEGGTRLDRIDPRPGSSEAPEGLAGGAPAPRPRPRPGGPTTRKATGGELLAGLLVLLALVAGIGAALWWWQSQPTEAERRADRSLCGRFEGVSAAPYGYTPGELVAQAESMRLELAQASPRVRAAFEEFLGVVGSSSEPTPENVLEWLDALERVLAVCAAAE